MWSVLGDGLPLFVALFTIPKLIAILGAERFGVLVIAWMVIGYLSLFDLGLGRSLTKFVAEKLGQKKSQEIPLLAGTAIIAMVFVGIVVASALAVLSPWIVTDVLSIPHPMRAEAIGAMRWLAVTTPFVITGAALIGLLQAFQCFGRISAVRVPLGIFTFAAPLAVLQFRDDLILVTAALSLIRVVAWLALVIICFSVVPRLRSLSWSWRVLGKLLTFGGWLTVSNVVGPLMVYFDRFFIGAVLGMAAVAYYATPYEIVTRLWVFPTAVTAVAFPAIATALVADSERAVTIFKKCAKAIILALFPALLVLGLFSHEALSLWLDEDFAENSSLVLQIFAIGVFVNSFARVPFTLIQGCGRADLIAKVHLLELPLYAMGLWWALHAHGIEGAALVWLFRIFLDAIILTRLSAYLVPGVSRVALNTLAWIAALSVALGLAFLIPVMFWRTFFALCVGAACVYLGWREFGGVIGVAFRKQATG